MERVVKINVYESKTTVVTQRISVPDSDRLIIVSHHSDVHDDLASLTLVSMTGMDYSIAMVGDTSISTIAYIIKVLDLEDESDTKRMPPEKLWESYITKYLCHKYGGQKRLYDTV